MEREKVVELQPDIKGGLIITIRYTVLTLAWGTTNTIYQPPDRQPFRK